MSDDRPPSLFRKWAMRQYWRMQQSQAVVGLLLWGTTITLLVWPYVRWRFEATCNDAMCFNDTIIGIPATYFGLVAIFMTVMLGVLTIGYLYDQVFSLWTEWRSVDMERNPYVTYALTPNWMMITALQAEILRRQSEDDEAMQAQAEWFLNWCAKNTQTGKCLLVLCNVGTTTWAQRQRFGSRTMLRCSVRGTSNLRTKTDKSSSSSSRNCRYGSTVPLER